MTDLSTSYMGLKLSNPVIVGSSDLTASVKGVIRCEEAGAGAVALKSFFEEQFVSEVDPAERGSFVYPEALDYLERGGLLEYSTQKICQIIEEAKKQVKIPIIASVNCQSSKLWPTFAHHFEDSGADALELNIYYLPYEVHTPGTEYEKFHLQILEEVKKSVGIPVSVKLSHQLTSIPYLGQKLAEAGCKGLVFFNWFLQPDIDIGRMKTRNIIGKGDFYQSLHWVALCAGRVDCDIASSGGVRRADQVIKLLLAGASAVQVASLFYQEGLEALPGLLRGLGDWMEEHAYRSVDDFKGELSFKKQQLSFREPEKAEAYFRAQYLRTYLKRE
jgi:dihydroorotate dehydrogenase (fumarate)